MGNVVLTAWSVPEAGNRSELKGRVRIAATAALYVGSLRTGSLDADRARAIICSMSFQSPRSGVRAGRDPDGLSEHQRSLLNTAHQAIVRSSGLGSARWLSDPDRAREHRSALLEAQRALRTAQDAHVPRSILERTIKSAAAIGRDRPMY